MTAAAPPDGPAAVFRSLYELATRAIRSRDREELCFRILNDTVRVAPYDRAVLWDLRGSTPRLAGVSGREDVNPRSPAAKAWRRAVEALEDPARVQRLGATVGPPPEGGGDADAPAAQAAEALWLPLAGERGLLGGLWLERWGGTWTEAERDVLGSLMESYAAAWERLGGGRRRGPRAAVVIPAAVIVLVVVLALVRQPIRVAAPCEVVAADPAVVTAPVEGVIAGMRVRPGQRVAAGDVLFVYDRADAAKELEAAEEEVRAVASKLRRLRFEALREAGPRAEAAMLRHVLAKARARADLARMRLARMAPTAPTAGVVRLEKAHEWTGKPVAQGDPVLRIVRPEATELRVWIPQADNLAFDRDAPVEVILGVAPDRTLRARLVRVGMMIEAGPAGAPAFPAEAAWAGAAPPVRIGLRGTAVLRGPEASLLYALVRKPWSKLRQMLGV